MISRRLLFDVLMRFIDVSARLNDTNCEFLEARRRTDHIKHTF